MDLNGIENAINLGQNGIETLGTAVMTVRYFLNSIYEWCTVLTAAGHQKIMFGFPHKKLTEKRRISLQTYRL